MINYPFFRRNMRLKDFVPAINTPTLNFPKPPQGIVIYIFFVTKKFYIK